jgi:nucleoside-diphosphate-sugar epimerase
MAKHDGVIKMRTDGTESRQFLYADDACEALLTLAKKYKKLDKKKNIQLLVLSGIKYMK